MISMRYKLFVLGCAVSALTLGSAAAQQAEDRSEQPEFGGAYADLTPRQKALIDDLYRRFSELTGVELDSEETYDQARLSSRTTYEAVTHALGTTTLTDENGASLGTSLDLIENLESVHGKIKGARGDHQFRMYVRLKPGAVDTLNRSQEFSRGPGNFVYHKGYPLNYRQGGGIPSIQFSVMTNLERADIDVDYRSAKFPAALFNGHLTAATPMCVREIIWIGTTVAGRVSSIGGAHCSVGRSCEKPTRTR